MTWRILVLALCVSTALAAEVPTVDEVLASLKASRDPSRPVTIHARFVQENVTEDETYGSSGSIVYAQPKRIVIAYETGAAMTYVADNTTAYEYDRELKQVKIYDLAERPEAEIFFLGFHWDGDTLKSNYDLATFPPEKAPAGTVGLALTPKPRDDEPAFFKEIRLFLRKEDRLPYRIEVENSEESHVTIRIQDFEVQQGDAAAAPEVSLPEGTTIIEQDQVVGTVGPDGDRIPFPERIPVEVEELDDGSDPATPVGDASVDAE